MYKTKLGLQLSKFDQENLALKIEEWKKRTDDTHFFRPYIRETEVNIHVDDEGDDREPLNDGCANLAQNLATLGASTTMAEGGIGKIR